MTRFSLDGMAVNSGAALIALMLEQHGYLRSQPVSLGAHRLADWLVKNGDCLATRLAVLQVRPLDRILCGEVVPSPEACEFLAVNTLGAVLPEMFEQLGPELDPVESARPAPDRELQRTHCQPLDIFPGSMGADLPSGQLFNAYADDGISDGFLLAGMGLAMRIDAPTAYAMRDALDAGIAHLQASVSLAGRSLGGIAA